MIKKNKDNKINMRKTQNYPLKSASVKVCTLFVLLVKFCALDFNFYDFSGLSTDGQKATFGDLNLYYGLHNKTILIQNKKKQTPYLTSWYRWVFCLKSLIKCLLGMISTYLQANNY